MPKRLPVAGAGAQALAGVALAEFALLPACGETSPGRQEWPANLA